MSPEYESENRHLSATNPDPNRGQSIVLSFTVMTLAGYIDIVRSIITSTCDTKPRCDTYSDTLIASANGTLLWEVESCLTTFVSLNVFLVKTFGQRDCVNLNI